ncbi:MULTISPECIES: alpha/beta fold hydrolase [unclassified Curtobacterium]|uniref:alpha/beta fold hydrolase n=1 Tax=Curtobacterium sp. PhB134 TaxID=2485180 RepID=UPI0024374555|nr:MULTISPECIES: alpha/beta fold hydrolase [unclassified Curtobacterium]
MFLHGTPWSSWLWRPIALAMAGRFTVYLWDMPGYGASSKDPSHAVDLGTQGELFAALLEHWGLDRPHVVAHDFGGAVALRARLLHGATPRCASSTWWRSLPGDRPSSSSSKSTLGSSNNFLQRCTEVP